MKKKTNSTTTKKTDVLATEGVMTLNQVDQDAKNALLIVSLLANAFVLIGWIALQVTNIYDYQVAMFLFSR